MEDTKKKTKKEIGISTSTEYLHSYYPAWSAMVRTRTICKYTVPRSRNSFICTRENTFCILQSCVTEKREWPHTLLLHRPFIIHRCQGSKCQVTYTLACRLFIRLINVASLRDMIPRNERRWNIYVSCTIFFLLSLWISNIFARK